MTAIPLFDAHCDTISLCAADGRALRKNGGHLDLDRLGGFSNAAQVFALFADSAHHTPDSLMAHCTKMQEVFMREVTNNADILTFCPGGKGIREANAAGKLAALLSIEGGELLCCDPENLSAAAEWGVRSVNITWNHANALAGSHIEQPEKGLTPIGTAWIKECDRLNILTDVSHLSDRAFWDLVDITSKPVLATHSNSRAVCGHTRNLTDDMFRAICQTGGIAGLNLYIPFVGGDGSMDALIRHVDHFMELGGEKHIALGCDLDGCDELAGEMGGVQDLPLLWAALSAHGYDDATLEDIFRNNLLRVLERE